ncbi:hypothetical protein DICPUDRAFT_26339 [Dictyostelium purpureum]|uniref:Uncharacterized protein n=1 Tax=Dictyostelium purpureum TaxID=5786 RepID=F0Z8I0_DICPU|nr:uncharacterized protein DICPUDRAFT_26339 [Dictyostelium purpureum]EGC39759.1 hypothetical protein DICPUDRAFT_26339 [Dictyostelium purpureum]|eukprot:XP_003283745.1 hypothetical protein DICPUDRAFT_26339 [Dictyostelium purpureum]
MTVLRPGDHYDVPTKGKSLANLVFENEGDELGKLELKVNGNIQENIEIQPHSTQNKSMIDIGKGHLTIFNIGKTHIKLL